MLSRKKKGISYMRIDTHKDNRYAIKLFENHGYVYCGWINLNQKKAILKDLPTTKYYKGLS